jgi:hypothetical protein
MFVLILFLYPLHVSALWPSSGRIYNYLIIGRYCAYNGSVVLFF